MRRHQFPDCLFFEFRAVAGHFFTPIAPSNINEKRADIYCDRGGGTSATRHSITVGGGDYLGAVPCRYINISDMELDNFNTLPADGGGAAPVRDMHSNSEVITYDNGVFKNGAGFNGANTTIRNSSICSMRSDAAGCAIYGSEI